MVSSAAIMIESRVAIVKSTKTMMCKMLAAKFYWELARCI